jgi:hypothetical protein
MMATSGGSQAEKGKEFLTSFLNENYAAMKEDEIRQLQREKIPAEGDYALKGRERRDMKRMAELGIVRV